MNSKQFQKEVDYHVAISLWEEMLDTGIIDRQDFIEIDKMYIDRYHPIFRSATHINDVRIE